MPGNLLNLLERHLWIQGEREDLQRRLLGARKAALPLTEVGVGALQMNRTRIMDAAANACLLQSSEHLIAIAAADAHNEQVIDMLNRPGSEAGQSDPILQVCQFSAVPFCNLASIPIPSVQVS